MWSYYETAASSVGTSSSASTNETDSTTFTSAFGGTTHNFLQLAQFTQSRSAEFVSANSSSTYLNPTNTTQTLTTTYQSVHLTTFGSTLSTASGFDTIAVNSSSLEVTQWVSAQTDASVTIFSQQVTTGSTLTFGTVATSVTRIEGTIYSISSVIGGSIFITRSTLVSATGFGQVSGSTTVTTTSLWNSSFAYNSSTTTFTLTENAQTTVTSTRSSTFLATVSTTNSTGTQATTATSSSADNFTSSSTTTASATSTSYQTGSFSLPCIIGTVVEFNTNEWGWSVSTSGSDRVESIGVSFTRTTFNATMGAGAVTGPTFTIPSSVSSLTFTITSFTSRTTASTRATSTQSTYHVAKSSTVVPFTDTTRIATISYTTSTGVTLTWSSSSTRTSSSTYVSSTTTTGVTSVVPTTFTGGTSLSSVTFTQPTTLFAFTAASGASGSKTILVTIVSASASISYVRDSSVGASAPSVAAITIGDGWQAQSLGRLQAVGTNLAAGTASTVSQVATIWPLSVQTPVAESSNALAIAGSVPTTRTNIRATSRIGGYGWDRTTGSTATQTAGVHRITTCNGSSSGTTEKTWTPVNSTLAMTEGEAIAAEAVPLVNSASATGGDSQFLSFSAFPST